MSAAYSNNTLPRPNKAAAAERPRPASLYDNICTGQQSTDDHGAPGPTQALCLATTVPVNLARASIAGRHTPTRASVRHSRMLVLSQQTGRVPWKYLPPVVRWHRLASLLMFLLVLSGSTALLMAIYLTMFAPFLAIHDLPFWSGALNLMAGIAGFTLACWCRRVRPGVVAPDWVCAARQPYIALCIGVVVLACASSICAVVFATLRLIWFVQIECLARLAHASMLTSENRTESQDLSKNDPSCVCTTTDGRQFEGLACSKARLDLIAMIVGSGALHLIAAFLAIGFLVIHWRSRRYGQPVHTSLRHTTPPIAMEHTAL